jgi:hypothetical protein
MVQFAPPLGATNVVCTVTGCRKLYTYSGSAGGTTNLWSHLKSKHPEIATELGAGSSRSEDAKENVARAYEGAADQLRQSKGSTEGEQEARNLVSSVPIGLFKV